MRTKSGYSVENSVISVLTGKPPRNSMGGGLPEQSLFNWNEAIMYVIVITQLQLYKWRKSQLVNIWPWTETALVGHWLRGSDYSYFWLNAILLFHLQFNRTHNTVFCVRTLSRPGVHWEPSFFPPLRVKNHRITGKFNLKITWLQTIILFYTETSNKNKQCLRPRDVWTWHWTLLFSQM